MENQLKPTQSQPVDREPLDPAFIASDLSETFTFANLTPEQAAQYKEIENACHNLALLIARKLPEGKEHVVAINNILSAALWVRHGLSRRHAVVLGTGAPAATPTGANLRICSACGKPFAVTAHALSLCPACED